MPTIVSSISFLVWAADRLARSVRHFLEVLDTLNHLEIEFVSFRENIDTCGPLGRAVVIIVSAVAELVRNLIIERVRAGLRRARLEGRVLGRKPIAIDRAALLRDRSRGLSLAQLAKTYKISRTSVARALKQPAGIVSKPHFLRHRSDRIQEVGTAERVCYETPTQMAFSGCTTILLSTWRPAVLPRAPCSSMDWESALSSATNAGEC